MRKVKGVNFKQTKFFILFKSNRKFRLFSMVAISCVSLLFLVNFAKYVANVINNYFVTTQNFYFNSNKLVEGDKEYVIENWSGVEDYTILISLDSRDNNLKASSMDITYNASCSGDNKVDCQIQMLDGATQGILPATTNYSSFNVIITKKPTAVLNDGDEVIVNVVANATDPYEKTISARFKLVIGDYGLTYKIEDEPGRLYANALITNAMKSYTCNLSTSNPTKNISIQQYKSMTPQQQADCASAVITLTFDPNLFRIDESNEVFLRNINYTTGIASEDGKSYYNQIVFKVDAESSSMIKFYKVNSVADYTYPTGENTPTIGYSAQTYN